MGIKTYWNAFKRSLVHFVYPSQCLHCGELVPPGPLRFCSGCASLLELINPDERCLRCFNWNETSAAFCKSCRYLSPVFYRVGAAFDYNGPAASLIKRLKYGNQPYLAEGAGACLVAQLDRLKWPLPDAIIPVPISFIHWMDRGYNQSELLARQMGRLLKIPVWNALKRYSGDYSQAGLTIQQRLRLNKKSFELKKPIQVRDKTLLVIDDVMTTGNTLQCCGEILLEECPRDLYALTFCRAISI